LFGSEDEGRIRAWLALDEPLDADIIPALARLLARNNIRDATARRLIAIGERAGQPLAAILSDDSADFVVRRRIAGVLGVIPGEEAFNGLIGALSADRFEVRYRAARSLSRRRAESDARLKAAAWDAIRSELSRGRAVWELARLLDQNQPDELVEVRATQRGELSLEHVFRLLSFVLDAEAIHAAWNGIMGDDTEVESLALEYLEQVLPGDIRERLWPFIGDLTAEQARRSIRPLDDVIEDLMETGATLFGGDHRRALARYLERSDDSV
jgi:HEAT repeat protein